MMDRRWGVSLGAVLVLAALLGELMDPVASVDDKCLACRTVAEQITLGLITEKPRNHLDMRHRLDSKGQREGKVINYKYSELRVVDLLEGLCAKFSSYSLTKGSKGKRQWTKVYSEFISAKERQEADLYSKELVYYCGRLMEETDEELTSMLQKGLIQSGDVHQVLCMDLTGHCRPTRSSDESSQESSKEPLPAEVRGGSDGEL